MKRDEAGLHAKPDEEQREHPMRIDPDTTWPDRMTGKDSEPAADPRIRKPARRQPVPTCDMTRKRYAALRLARDSCSVATKAAVARS